MMSLIVCLYDKFNWKIQLLLDLLTEYILFYDRNKKIMNLFEFLSSSLFSFGKEEDHVSCLL